MLSVLAIVIAAASAPAPIHVDACSFVRAGSLEHSVAVRFHNTSQRTATLVTFEVYNGPHHVTVSDSGTFAPGVEIEHRLATPSWELYHAQPHACVVRYVHFADGTSWGG